MKKFVYDVAGFEFEDTAAFGAAWRAAKAKAAELNAAIYRDVIKNETVRREVYLKGGCFVPVSMAEPEEVAIF